MKKTVGAQKKKFKSFSDAERTAMKERVKELNMSPDDQKKAVMEKINKMPEPDRSMAKMVHEIIMTTAPTLSPRLWYGMPAYSKNGKVICFFQDAHKFKSRYATLGFSDKATLDEGNMWPTGFALKQLTTNEEKKIRELVKRATV